MGDADAQAKLVRLGIETQHTPRRPKTKLDESGAPPT
jgi:hypothetical protein